MRQPLLSLRVTLAACALGAIAQPALAQTAHDDSAVSPAVASKQKHEIAKGDPKRWYSGDNTPQARLAIQKKEIAAAYSEAKNACRKEASGQRKQCLADATRSYRHDLADARDLVAHAPQGEVLAEVGPVETTGTEGSAAVGASGTGASASGSSGTSATASGSEPTPRDWTQKNEYRAVASQPGSQGSSQAGSQTGSAAGNQAGPLGAQVNQYQSGPVGNQPSMRQAGPTGTGQAGAAQPGAGQTGTSQYGVGGTGSAQSGMSQSGMTGSAAGQSGMGQSGAAGAPAGQPATGGASTTQPGATGSSQTGATGTGVPQTDMRGSDATRPGAPPPELPRADKPASDQRY